MNTAKRVMLILLVAAYSQGCGGTSQRAKYAQAESDLKYLYELIESYRINHDGAMPVRIGFLFDSEKSHFSGIEDRVLTGFSGSRFLNDRSSLMYFPRNYESGNSLMPLLSSYRTFNIKGEVGHIVLWANGEITYESVERLDDLVLEYHLSP